MRLFSTAPKVHVYFVDICGFHGGVAQTRVNGLEQGLHVRRNEALEPGSEAERDGFI